MSCWMLPPFDPVDAQIRVVLPVCNMDFELMLRNLSWQCELDGRKPFDCVLSIDPEVHPANVAELVMSAWTAFSDVDVYQYPSPPNKAYPNASNWAFQHTARYMMSGGRSWYWMEADAIPVRPGWLTFLNQRYNVCQRPMMGSIVRGMGHCNGTAIYPARNVGIGSWKVMSSGLSPLHITSQSTCRQLSVMFGLVIATQRRRAAVV